MEVMPGYKQTKVGVIPNDWNVEKIGDLIDKRFILGHLDGNHGELYPRSNEFKAYGVPYIGANDFEEGSVTFAHCKFLNEERAAKFRKGVARDGDVLFAHNATVGPVALLKTVFPFVILSTTATYFRCNPEKLNNSFLKVALQAPQFVRQYRAVMAQSTRSQVPITAQRKLSLVIAPLPEQRAIAAALSDVDALLNSLDRLIAKKRDLKKASMQQLLTGQTRLPGFSGEWEVKCLGDLAEIVMGQSPSSVNYNSQGFGLPLIQGNADIVDRHTIRRFFTTQITKKGRTGDILMSVRAPVGEVSHAMFDVCLGRGVCAIRFPNEWLYHFLIFIEPTWAKHSKGSTFDSVNSTDIKVVEVRLTVDQNEQIAIAKVLNEMDKELSVLQHRRNKTAALKQGMMQELLTGRTRLV